MEFLNKELEGFIKDQGAIIQKNLTIFMGG